MYGTNSNVKRLFGLTSCNNSCWKDSVTNNFWQQISKNYTQRTPRLFQKEFPGSCKCYYVDTGSVENAIKTKKSSCRVVNKQMQYIDLGNIWRGNQDTEGKNFTERATIKGFRKIKRSLVKCTSTKLVQCSYYYKHFVGNNGVWTRKLLHETLLSKKKTLLNKKRLLFLIGMRPE